MTTYSIDFHDDRPRRRGPHAGHCTDRTHLGACPPAKPPARREEEELPPPLTDKNREVIELPDPGLAARKEIVDTYEAAATRSGPLSTIEKVLALHGPAVRTTIMKIESKPVVGIDGDLLSNTVTVTIRQSYYLGDGTDE